MYNKDKYTKQKMVVVGAFILGILLAIYLKTLDPTKVYITLEEKRSIENRIETTKREIKKLNTMKSDYEQSLKKYKDVVKDKHKSINDLMEDDLTYLKEVSGYINVKGPGIVVTIKDSEKELEKDQNPNDLIVHDIDILRIINDLKKAGAEAIAINGERVLPLSKIKCSGATITVNNTTYGQPFIIKAIGNTDSLMAAIISPGSYANLIKDGYGIYVEAQVEEDIDVNSAKNINKSTKNLENIRVSK
ncbi:DUF881 domain-containing protein [Romboutsia sp.]|uniref:DUF881 domain-containing protein n=1 Tax=Romboutsia sp. TaxID=1965302 RepID=UPI003F3653FC